MTFPVTSYSNVIIIAITDRPYWDSNLSFCSIFNRLDQLPTQYTKGVLRRLTTK